jgi:NMT1/THI5 like
MLRMGPSCYHVLHLVPPMLAHEMNFFVDEGLRDDDGRETYQLIPESHAPFMFERDTLWQTLKERGIDVTMDTKPSTVAHCRMQGQELYVIAGWRNQQPFYVMGQPGIESLADLAGRRIGIIDLDDVLVTMLSYWLIQDDVDLARVEWVTKIDTRRGPAALRDGRVDAAFVDGLDLAAMQAEGYTLLLDVASKYPEGRPDRVIAATGRAIEEQPEQLAAFIRGMIRAYWFLRTMPENVRVTQALEQRLRRHSPDPDEPKRLLQFGSAEHAERMPFPIDGNATGFEKYLMEAVTIGTLPEYVAPHEITRLDLARDAFGELSVRPDLRGDLERVQQVTARLGY